MRANRKTPYLSIYLNKLEGDSVRAAMAHVPQIAWLVAALGMTVIAGLGGLITGNWVPATGFAVLFAVSAIIVMGFANQRNKLRDDPREKRRRDVFKTASELRELDQNRRLHKWMDPIALQLLEAGAYHWSRIQTTLSGPQWGSRELPAYWQQLKVQVNDAAHEGMADLLLLARNCVGPPQKNRENDIKDIVESFVGLDLIDALQGLKQMANADWTAYAHQSPQAEAVAIHGRSIAERMKELADDVDAKASEIAIDSATSGGLQSLDALDCALDELRTVRQAESELEQRIGRL